MGAGTLEELLAGFDRPYDPDLLVGYETSDDASVYRLNDTTAVINTADFFPPIVDNPYLFGQIAAANSMSDIYAMGGMPKLALNLMCVREDMPPETVRQILKGGYDKAAEAGVIITGGHTIKGDEPLYGLSVTGFGDPARILTNSGVRPGDRLILTKPLGVGIIMTAAKAGLADEAVMAEAAAQMAQLNKLAAEVMKDHPVTGCTDVTGFGLLGHAYEMAFGSGVMLTLNAERIPMLPAALEYASLGLIPAGAYRNRDHVEVHVSMADTVSLAAADVLYDPQTSGGLLIAVPERHAAALLHALKDRGLPAAEIGYAGPMTAHIAVRVE